MRKILFLSTVLAFVFTSSVWAADISGTWGLNMSGYRGEVSMDLNIKAAGENLTVTAIHPNFGEMVGTGTLKGNAITINITATGGRKLGLALKGTVTGNKMEGTREMVFPSGEQGGAPAAGQAPAGAQGAPPGGAPPGGQAPAGAQGTPTGGAPPGGQAPAGAQGAPGGAPPGGQAPAGGQGAPGGAQSQISDKWTAEKK
jgi:hypothetical protein